MWNIRICLESSQPNRYILLTSKRFKSAKAKSAEYKQPKTSVDRALDHYDDFYSSVYGGKWPSLRLGLLTAPKFIAVPNTFIETRADVSAKLEKLGALDVKSLWRKGAEIIQNYKQSNAKDTEREESEESKRLKDLDRAVRSFAQTKVAEEMDTLYQNAPDRKLPVRATEGIFEDRRVLSDVREASQEYITPTKLKGMEEFDLESAYFASYHDEMEEIEEELQSGIFQFTNRNNFTRMDFPGLLRPYCFEPGNPNDFPPAGKQNLGGLRDYLCVNGASLAPVLALDLKLDVEVLDLCAGPGTKSLLILMTMFPSLLTCNDLETSRISRIKRIFQEFLGNPEPNNVKFTKSSAAKFLTRPEYHRVLADVPCTTDRISLTIQDNNMFKPTRTKERLGIAVLQKNILLSSFNSLLPESGSSCVYSTCSLSPIENDGVVAAALKENTVPGIHVDLLGLWKALHPFQAAGVFQLNRSKFGVLIEPNVCSNFGPMFISRFVVKPQRHTNTSASRTISSSSSRTNNPDK